MVMLSTVSAARTRMPTICILLFPDFLQQIFDTCYDEDVISEAAFRAWYDATDREEDGNGVAKLSVVNFFLWLDEADDEADDDNAITPNEN